MIRLRIVSLVLFLGVSFSAMETLANNNLNEAAANLYKTMRIIKKKGYKKIFVTKIPNLGPGIAINDRLKRASN